MKRTGLLIALTVTIALLAGVFGCRTAPTATAPPTTAPAPKPTASPSPSPAPSPKPSPSPSPGPSPSPSPTVAPSPAQPKVIKWKGQTHTPKVPGYSIGPGHSMKYSANNSQWEPWAKWVSDLTKGQFTVDVAPPGTYAGTNEMFEAVQTRMVDMVTLYGGYYTGKVPEANVSVGMPFAWEVAEEAWDAYFNWGLYKELQAVYAGHNLKWFPFAAHTYSLHFMTNFPLDHVDAIKGKKIRAVGIQANYVQNLGGIPVNIPTAETYMAAKLGTIDGIFQSTTQLEETKLKEVVKYVLVSPNTTTAVADVLINLDSWKALPEDWRYMIEEYSYYILWTEAMSRYIGDIVGAKMAADYGVKLVRWTGDDLDKARAAGIATWDQVAALSPRVAKLVGIVKAQAKAFGKIK